MIAASMLIVAVTAIVVAGAWANGWMTPDTDDPAISTRKGWPSKLKFAEAWANRYQTLIAGLVALLAAAATVTSVTDQLEEMRRQTAASALTVLQQRAEYFRQVRLDFAKAGPSAIAATERYVAAFPTYDPVSEHLNRARLPLQDLRSLMQAPVGALAGSKQLQAVRTQIESVIDAMGPDIEAIWEKRARLAYADPVPMPARDASAEIGRIKASLQNLRVEFEKLSQQLDQAQADANSRLVDAERQAFP